MSLCDTAVVQGAVGNVMNWKGRSKKQRVLIRSPALAEVAKDSKPRVEPGNYRI